jgi:hypothetical protein
MSTTTVNIAQQIVERSAVLLDRVKARKDTIRLSDIDKIRSAMREAEGYLDSVRKILDGRPL